MGRSRTSRIAVGAVVVAHHDLEQRVAARLARRVDRLHDPFEGHVLVLEDGQVGVPDPGQQFGERRVAGQVGAQHQRVDEKADQIVQGAVGAPGDRGAQRDVGARPIRCSRVATAA